MRLKNSKKTLLIMNIVLSLLCLLLLGICVADVCMDNGNGRNIAIKSIYMNMEHPGTVREAKPTVIYVGGASEAPAESDEKDNTEEEIVNPDTSENEVLQTGSGTTAVFPLQTEVKLKLASDTDRAGNFVISPDGSFVGDYISKAVLDGEDYVVKSEFQGKLQNVRQMNEHAYAATLSELLYTNKQAGHWVEDGKKYIFAEPSVLKPGEEFVLYLPGTPQEEVPESMRALYAAFAPGEMSDTYALLCETSKLGYFGNK
ncbi:MAG: hypothetical protein IJE10_00430 [Clostridia bacterium]|nr:hypothetical protein [Clostridia bacterium]